MLPRGALPLEVLRVRLEVPLHEALPRAEQRHEAQLHAEQPLL